MHFLLFSGPWKNGLRWPQIGPGGFFPTNPDLADILGRKDFDFENFYFFDFFGIPNYQISRSPEIWPGPGLGRAWAGLGRASALGRVGREMHMR